MKPPLLAGLVDDARWLLLMGRDDVPALDAMAEPELPLEAPSDAAVVLVAALPPPELEELPAEPGSVQPAANNQITTQAPMRRTMTPPVPAFALCLGGPGELRDWKVTPQ